MLEMDFEPVEDAPVDYKTLNNVDSQYWHWRHKHTGITIKRVPTASGRSFDTGKLSSHLKNISDLKNPVGYHRAMHILLLNGQRRGCLLDDQEEEAVETHDRSLLLLQQVSQPTNRCSTFHSLNSNHVMPSVCKSTGKVSNVCY